MYVCMYEWITYMCTCMYPCRHLCIYVNKYACKCLHTSVQTPINQIECKPQISTAANEYADQNHRLSQEALIMIIIIIIIIVKICTKSQRKCEFETLSASHTLKHRYKIHLCHTRI